ncbi:DUF7380 domain-containing protein [Nostoc sp.]|uniref:DUF7380 domain-containing protein n=1 Tax=Nostoc sp. TaxID=1180 RepID=UPI003FA5834E
MELHHLSFIKCNFIENWYYNRVFWNKAQEAKEAGNVREQSVFEILVVVTDAAIQPRSNELLKIPCLIYFHLELLMRWVFRRMGQYSEEIL